MKKTVNISDFSEETFWVVKCPNCDEYIETTEDPNYLGELYCDQCASDIKVTQ